MTAPKMSEVFRLPLRTERESDGSLEVYDATDWLVHVDPFGGEDAIRVINAHDALVEALRSCPCPRPANSRSDDFTTAKCVDAGECGCSHGAALALAEGRS